MSDSRLKLKIKLTRDTKQCVEPINTELILEGCSHHSLPTISDIAHLERATQLFLSGPFVDRGLSPVASAKSVAYDHIKAF